MDELRFEWDEKKSKTNLEDHGVSFEEAKTVFYDEFADQFFKLNIDGDILLSLTPQQLKDDVGVMNGIASIRYLTS